VKRCNNIPVVDFRIEKEDFGKLLQCLKSLLTNGDFVSAFGEHNADNFMPVLESGNVSSALKLLGIVVVFDERGICSLQNNFNDDTLEDFVLPAIASVVKGDCHIDITFDDAYVRYVFHDGECKVEYGDVVFPSDTAYVVIDQLFDGYHMGPAVQLNGVFFDKESAQERLREVIEGIKKYLNEHFYSYPAWESVMLDDGYWTVVEKKDDNTHWNIWSAWIQETNGYQFLQPRNNQIAPAVQFVLKRTITEEGKQTSEVSGAPFSCLEDAVKQLRYESDLHVSRIIMVHDSVTRDDVVVTENASTAVIRCDKAKLEIRLAIELVPTKN
jgi:hypothetical protein